MLQNFLYTAKTQQLLVRSGLRGPYTDVKEPADRTPLKDIKLLLATRRNGSADRRNQERYTRCSATERFVHEHAPGRQRPPEAGRRGRSFDWTALFSAGGDAARGTRVFLFWLALTSVQDDAKIFTLAHFVSFLSIRVRKTAVDYL